MKRFATLGNPDDLTCLELLKELAAREDGLLSLALLKASKRELAYDIQRFINEHWMNILYKELPDSKKSFFFDQLSSTLIAYDPQLTFYLKHLSFPALAQRVGKVQGIERQRVLLCYHNSKTHEKWLKRLRVHLKLLEREGSIDFLDISKKSAGAEWEKGLHIAVETARVTVLLVSQEFLNSDSIRDNQLPRLLLQAQDAGNTILPLIIEHCQFEHSGLHIFQPVNSPGRPLEEMSRKFEWAAILVKLAENIRAN